MFTPTPHPLRAWSFGILCALLTGSSLAAQDLISLLTTGNTSGNWNTTTANWYASGDAAKAPLAWTQGRVARLPATTTQTYTLTLTQSITAAGLLAGNENNTYNLNGTAHTLTLSGNIGPGKFVIAPAVIVATAQTWTPGGGGNGDISLNNTLTLDANLTLAPRRTTRTHRFDGIISGTGSFTLTPVADANVTVRFNQPNTFSGGVTVNGGTLLVTNSSGSATGPGAVLIKGTGSLAGTGRLAGAVTLASGATLRPGAAATTETPATLTFDSSLTLETGSTTLLDVAKTGTAGTDFDQLVVTGAAQLAGTLKINLQSALTTGSFTLLSAATTGGHFTSVVLTGAHTGTLTRSGSLWSGSDAWDIPFSFDETTGRLRIGYGDDEAGESIVFPPYAESGVINVKTDLTTITLTDKVIANPSYDSALPVSTANPVTILYTGPISSVNAAGDGVTDDTAALQAALDAYPSGNRIIYLPAGIYKVTGRLDWPVKLNTDGTKVVSSAYKRTILQGRNRDTTIIRLADNSAGYGDAATVKPLVFTGDNASGTGDGAQRFRNAVRNLTLNTGKGNPGAAALQFNASNQGVVADVRLRCPDVTTPGQRGLDLSFTADNGPLLIRDLIVEGFEVGVQAYSGKHTSMIALENITLSGQLTYGLENQQFNLFIRNLTSTNAVPAINQRAGTGGQGVLTLVHARLKGLTGASEVPAIQTAGRLYVSDAAHTGYGSLITSTAGTGADVSGAGIAEFETSRTTLSGSTPGTTPLTTGFTHAGTTTPDTGRGMLNLPVKETPRIPWETDLGKWINVGALTPAANGDYTAAINAAILATPAKTTLFFPCPATYTIRGTVNLTNGIRRVVGGEGRVTGGGTFRLIDNDTTDAVIIERIDNLDTTVNDPGYEQASSRPLVLSSIRDARFIRTDATSGTGDLFLEDIVTPDESTYTSPRLQLDKAGQRTWARQLNTESGNALNIRNDGAHLWILGYKTERGNTKIATLNGGYTELYGWNIYRNTDDADTVPGIIVGSGTAAANYSHVGILQRKETRTPRAEFYSQLVRETRGELGAKTTTESSLVAAYPEWTSLVHRATTDPPATPTATYDTATLNLQGRGTGLGGTADTVHYRHYTRRLPGDGELSARLTTLDSATTAGLMLRADFGAGQPFVALTLDANGQLTRTTRATADATAVATTVGTGLSLPRSLRIVREGDRFWCHHRAAGATTWSLAGPGPVTIPMWTQILAGVTATGTGSASFDTLDGKDAAPTFAAAIEAAPTSLTYDRWLQLHFAPDERAAGTLTSKTADPDSDGLNNLLEYALGGTPTDASSAPAPAPISQLSTLNSQPVLTLTFTRARSELTYTVQGSSDLSTWTTVATNPGSVSTATQVTVTDTVPLSDQPKRFLRLHITVTP